MQWADFCSKEIENKHTVQYETPGDLESVVEVARQRPSVPTCSQPQIHAAQ